MDIELPDTISAETIQQAQPAVARLRAMLADGVLPAGLTTDAVSALLTVAEGVAQAAAEDNTDLNPSEAAERLRMARPSVMRLIARGELSSRKDGGHYVLSPRELRSFQARLASVRREALSDLAAMVDEFGF
ncbi:MAG: helix-turn-helix domain-containing protein [Acetobacteraceae bacterium]|jgi:excisionase family DNA binding protein